MKSKIAAIVVTYNRKELLTICLDAIHHQEYRPHSVFIIDNASTDGTEALVNELGYNGEKEGIRFIYVKLPENIGGSGGFYLGMKMAFESSEKFDAFWLMDDDGIPDKKQLGYLVTNLDQYDYISPMVVSKEDTSVLSFGGCPVSEFIQYAENDRIEGAANPFNGVLFSRKVVEKIGYPVRDMFIWGDEINYGRRCIKAGFNPVMDVRAVHVHPKDRQPRVQLKENEQITIPKEDWKLYCYVRNSIYNVRTISKARHYLKVCVDTWWQYTRYFTFRDLNWRKLGIVYRAIFDGYRKDLSRLSCYKK